MNRDIEKIDKTIEFLKSHKFGKKYYVSEDGLAFCTIGAFCSANGEAMSWNDHDKTIFWYEKENSRIRNQFEIIVKGAATAFNDKFLTTKEDVIKAFEETKVALSREYQYNNNLT